MVYVQHVFSFLFLWVMASRLGKRATIGGAVPREEQRRWEKKKKNMCEHVRKIGERRCGRR